MTEVALLGIGRVGRTRWQTLAMLTSTIIAVFVWFIKGTAKGKYLFHSKIPPSL